MTDKKCVGCVSLSREEVEAYNRCDARWRAKIEKLIEGVSLLDEEDVISIALYRRKLRELIKYERQ